MWQGTKALWPVWRIAGLVVFAAWLYYLGHPEPTTEPTEPIEQPRREPQEAPPSSATPTVDTSHPTSQQPRRRAA